MLGSGVLRVVMGCSSSSPIRGGTTTALAALVGGGSLLGVVGARGDHARDQGGEHPHRRPRTVTARDLVNSCHSISRSSCLWCPVPGSHVGLVRASTRVAWTANPSWSWGGIPRPHRHLGVLLP